MSAYPGFSVVHLAMRRETTLLSIGSGVLYRRNENYYIVTAWHNLTGRHSETLRPISLTMGVPNNLVASIAQLFQTPQGRGSGRIPFIIPIEDSTNAKYFVHPLGWPRIDVAVIPIDPYETYDCDFRTIDGPISAKMTMMGETDGGIGQVIQPIQDCIGSFGRIAIQADKLIYPGDELFVLGYPRGITDYSLEPIWKRATVASDPQSGWNKESKFIIDCASREGMSGAPVISFSKTGRIQVGGMVHIGDGPSAFLQGIYVGRVIDSSSRAEDRFFEAQIGTVWKQAVIDEIIDAQTFGVHSNEIGSTPQRIDEAVRDAWPEDEHYSQKVLDNQGYLWLIVDEVLKKLNGNANPEEVKESVIRFANTFQQSNIR